MKEANNIKEVMNKNKEILVEGTILEEYKEM